jgi:hypothetical protein
MMGNRGKLLAAGAWLTAVAFGLKVAGLRRLLSLMPSPPEIGTGQSPQARLRLAWRQAELLNRAAQCLPFKLTCLQRAVALCWWLRARGVNASLQVGVLTGGNGRLQAHAWVEVDGQVVGDRPEIAGTFKPLSRPLAG